MKQELENFKQELRDQIREEMVVYVGDKETTTYAHSVKLITDRFGLAVIKARGFKISKAADVSQLALADFLEKEKWGTFVNVFTQNKESDVVRDRVDRVSVIEIFVMKSGGENGC